VQDNPPIASWEQRVRLRPGEALAAWLRTVPNWGFLLAGILAITAVLLYQADGIFLGIPLTPFGEKLLIGLIWVVVTLTIAGVIGRSTRRAPYEVDVLASEVPGQRYPVRIAIWQSGAKTGEDVGVAWFEGSYLNFRGRQTAFRVSSGLVGQRTERVEDVVPGLQIPLRVEGEDVRLDVAPFIRFASGKRIGKDFYLDVDHWERSRSPMTEGSILPPLEVAPDKEQALRLVKVHLAMHVIVALLATAIPLYYTLALWGQFLMILPLALLALAPPIVWLVYSSMLQLREETAALEAILYEYEDEEEDAEEPTRAG
jgi:hypothetical protein